VLFLHDLEVRQTHAPNEGEAEVLHEQSGDGLLVGILRWEIETEPVGR
jgi:hypothetical protein